ncbi:MAG: sodium-dependent transporter [Endomicrobium sp.]|jgi:NSS family neurotransmitter:Na+ symporter|nr:sodium-dependent transporter [Endomicrobium sp.]
MNSAKDFFSSKWGLIFAAAGSAIGLGNIWLFPYRVCEFGGATFIIPYIICLAILGFVAVIGEITIGRLTKSGPVNAFKKALELTGKNGRFGEFFGWLCVLVSLVQAIGYILVVSWVIRFVIGAGNGSAFYVTDSVQYFKTMNDTNVLLWIVISIILTGLAMAWGIEKGIEKLCKFMIPAVIILLLILAVRVFFIPNSIDGYKYLFTPKWNCLFNTTTWMAALGQVFYSLSIRGSTMIVYGSYAQKTQDIISSAKHIVILDTIASIIAALLIIPAVFAFGKDLNSGPSLLFITMPEIFKSIPLGKILMFIFFFAIFLAAITSLIGMLEVVIEVLQNKFKIVRWLAVLLVCVTIILTCKCFVVGNIKKIIDILSLHLIPFCALGSGIFVFWIVPKYIISQEIQIGCSSKSFSKFIILIGRYILCGIIIIIYIMHLD